MEGGFNNVDNDGQSRAELNPEDMMSVVSNTFILSTIPENEILADYDVPFVVVPQEEPKSSGESSEMTEMNLEDEAKRIAQLQLDEAALKQKIDVIMLKQLKETREEISSLEAENLALNERLTESFAALQLKKAEYEELKNEIAYIRHISRTRS